MQGHRKNKKEQQSAHEKNNERESTTTKKNVARVQYSRDNNRKIMTFTVL